MDGPLEPIESSQEEQDAYYARREADMNTIFACLRDARTYNLEVEIIYTAMNDIQNRPNATIEACITDAYNEWVKDATTL